MCVIRRGCFQSKFWLFGVVVRLAVPPVPGPVSSSDGAAPTGVATVVETLNV
jgi:hypothetical protein